VKTQQQSWSEPRGLSGEARLVLAMLLDSVDSKDVGFLRGSWCRELLGAANLPDDLGVQLCRRAGRLWRVGTFGALGRRHGKKVEHGS
jgi:hypothetical protein